MSPEEEKYYDNYFDLFLTEGWKQFVEETKELLDAFEIERISDSADLFFVKGQRSSLLNIVRFETGIKNAFESTLPND